MCTGFHVQHTFLHKNSMFGACLCSHSPPTPTRAPPNPTPDLVTQSSSSSCTCFRLHNIDLLNTLVPAPSLSLNVIKFWSKSAWQLPSLSSESKNSSHWIRARVCCPVYPPSKSSRHWIRFQVCSPTGSPPASLWWCSVIHQNPVLSNLGTSQLPSLSSIRVGKSLNSGLSQWPRAPAYFPSKSSRPWILFACSLESMIHWNPIVI